MKIIKFKTSAYYQKLLKNVQKNDPFGFNLKHSFSPNKSLTELYTEQST